MNNDDQWRWVATKSGQTALVAVIVIGVLALAPVAGAADQGENPGTAGKADTGGTRRGKSDERAQAKAAVERAQVDYQLGRFQDALDGYRRAYELYQSPSLLFDMGQCHRNLGNPDKAIFFFEGYLREETRLEPERRRLTEDLIVEARVDLQRKMALAAATASAPAAAAPAAAPPPPPATPRPVQLQAMDTQRVVPTTLMASPTESDRPAQREQPEQRSITTRWWFWTAIAGACAVAAGAAVYYVTGEPRMVPPQGTLGTYNPPSAAMTSTSP